MAHPQPDPKLEVRAEYTVTGANFSAQLKLRNNYVIEAPAPLRFLNGWRGTKALRYLRNRQFGVQEVDVTA